MSTWKTIRTLGYGVLVGTAGVKVLASADAKKWSIIGIVAGLIFQIIYLAFFGGLGYLSTLSH